MTILLWHILLPVATYFIGVVIGMKIEQKRCLDDFDELVKQRIVKHRIEDDSIQHVGYTPEQMGYDK